jgi:gamma-carbonic anhydrase
MSIALPDIKLLWGGHHTNIQDCSVLHLDYEHPCRLGNYVTVGHAVIVHGCTVGDETLIGMVLDRAMIGEQCLIGAKALVVEGAQIPDGMLALGVPAKVVRALTAKERRALRISAKKYAANAAYCLRHRINCSEAMS